MSATGAAGTRALLLLLLAAWLSGCGKPRLTDGTYASAMGTYAFQVQITGDTYDYSQPDNAEFPHFRGRCFLLEQTPEREKILGLTGMTNPPVIFIRIRKKPDRITPGVEISADDKAYFDNGWLWLKANPAMDRSPDHGK
ncbi:MAG: hypothetical protein WCI17_04580 [bacterium]